jgi:hypothetical protein
MQGVLRRPVEPAGITGDWESGEREAKASFREDDFSGAGAPQAPKLRERNVTRADRQRRPNETRSANCPLLHSPRSWFQAKLEG